jgi:hypothetical protein
MQKLLSLCFGATALILAIGASAANAARSAPSSPFTLVPAGQVGPSHGASTLPHGWIPLHAREYALAKAAANARAGVRGGGGRPNRGGGAPTFTSYSNVSPSFQGTYQTGGTPPDTTGAIGPDRYIETVNTQYAIYSRAGGLINSGPLSSLTGIAGGLFGYNLSDPQMMWDAKTQRFYYSAVYYDIFFSSTGLAVGWSKTATPASSADFCQYAISTGSDLADYPKLGDSSDFLLFGFNKFVSMASTYADSEFLTLNKPAAGAACAPTSAFKLYGSGALHNADSSLAATPVPANLVDDSNGAGYVVANADLSTRSSANFISLYTVTTAGNDASGIPIPTISGPTNVTVPAYSLPASAPQKGSSYLLDTLDGRFEAAVGAVDPGHGGIAVWTAHAVFGGPGSQERWYEIGPAGSLVQPVGTVGSSSLFAWNGAVSPDRASNGTTGNFGGSMAMSVSTSSTTAYPAIQLVWKKAGSSQSALSNLVQATGPSIDFSCSATAPCRWGDYSGASPDPAATGTVGKVWLGNQYNVGGGSTSSTSWRTWLFGVSPVP